MKKIIIFLLFLIINWFQCYGSDYLYTNGVYPNFTNTEYVWSDQSLYSTWSDIWIWMWDLITSYWPHRIQSIWNNLYYQVVSPSVGWIFNKSRSYFWSGFWNSINYFSTWWLSAWNLRQAVDLTQTYLVYCSYTTSPNQGHLNTYNLKTWTWIASVVTPCFGWVPNIIISSDNQFIFYYNNTTWTIYRKTLLWNDTPIEISTISPSQMNSCWTNLWVYYTNWSWYYYWYRSYSQTWTTTFTNIWNNRWTSPKENNTSQNFIISNDCSQIIFSSWATYSTNNKLYEIPTNATWWTNPTLIFSWSNAIEPSSFISSNNSWYTSVSSWIINSCTYKLLTIWGINYPSSLPITTTLTSSWTTFATNWSTQYNYTFTDTNTNVFWISLVWFTWSLSTFWSTWSIYTTSSGGYLSFTNWQSNTVSVYWLWFNDIWSSNNTISYLSWLWTFYNNQLNIFNFNWTTLWLLSFWSWAYLYWSWWILFYTNPFYYQSKSNVVVRSCTSSTLSGGLIWTCNTNYNQSSNQYFCDWDTNCKLSVIWWTQTCLEQINTISTSTSTWITITWTWSSSITTPWSTWTWNITNSTWYTNTTWWIIFNLKWRTNYNTWSTCNPLVYQSGSIASTLSSNFQNWILNFPKPLDSLNFLFTYTINLWLFWSYQPLYWVWYVIYMLSNSIIFPVMLPIDQLINIFSNMLYPIQDWTTLCFAWFNYTIKYQSILTTGVNVLWPNWTPTYITYWKMTPLDYIAILCWTLFIITTRYKILSKK